MKLKSTDITDLVVSSYGNYYWKAKINGLVREGSLDTKSISVTKSISSLFPLILASWVDKKFLIFCDTKMASSTHDSLSSNA